MTDRPTIHTFRTTGDAYDASQSWDAVRTGDILFVPSEGVIGLADTWPIAVTQEYGKLHAVREGCWKEQVDSNPKLVVGFLKIREMAWALQWKMTVEVEDVDVGA